MQRTEIDQYFEFEQSSVHVSDIELLKDLIRNQIDLGFRI